MLTKTEFALQVRLVLEHLHDYAALLKLPLVTALSMGQTRDQSVRQLRNEVLAAIEEIKPPGNLPPRAVERRPYWLLYGRYVQGMSTGELVEELAISVRQLRREQTKALAAITDLLWEHLAARMATAQEKTPPAIAAPHSERDTIQTEMERLIRERHMEDLALPKVVEAVLNTLAPVAAKHGVELDNRLPPDLPSVRADRIILRQGLLALISYALNVAGRGAIAIIGEHEHEVRMRIRPLGQVQARRPRDPGLETSYRLIESIGGQIRIHDGPGPWEIVVYLPMAQGVPVLVMDDNAGMIELFRRYLSGPSYHVLEAHTADQAIQVARELPVRLVILDVLMPQQDGWEILQRLRAAPETYSVPILICSALEQPEIAYALGASDYVTKPIMQDSFMRKVEHWCAAAPAQAVSPPELLPDSARPESE